MLTSPNMPFIRSIKIFNSARVVIDPVRLIISMFVSTSRCDWFAPPLIYIWWKKRQVIRCVIDVLFIYHTSPPPGLFSNNTTSDSHKMKTPENKKTSSCSWTRAPKKEKLCNTIPDQIFIDRSVRIDSNDDAHEKQMLQVHTPCLSASIQHRDPETAVEGHEHVVSTMSNSGSLSMIRHLLLILIDCC